MAARGIHRIARLTLFSGPQCSLCDTAKAELAKVRQHRLFELETVNIHDEGQERWKKKYVYWIPALHIEGKEVAKGRWDADTDSPLETPLYTRVHEDVLGDAVDNEASTDVHRCFNCGSPDHVVSTCPEPVHRALVALSRQLFNFFRGESSGPFHRIHEVEEWRRQRLAWLDAFEPGEIRGSALRDALGLEEGDRGEHGEWLKNMAYWGYPPGWIGERDPREHVWARITGAGEDSDSDDFEFTIHTDDGQECCTLPGTVRSNADADDDATSTSTPRRWAQYPATSLPAIATDDRPPPVSSTFTADPSSITPNGTASVPPWRRPVPPPPPPPSTPPPLPSTPLLCAAVPSSKVTQQHDDGDDDMDLSD
ncbi:hypothetical protein C8Q76DRAFT_778493 [Earliella scabrosa]|nr:hypothetical protein C8Q76DRAFT_778493 [Earliella scabrosa]